MTKRVRKHKRKRLKVGKLIIALIVLTGIGFVAIKGVDFAAKKIINKEYYIASNMSEVNTYKYNDENKAMDELAKITRGKKVTSHDKSKIIDEINYIEVFENDNSFYVKEENLTVNKDKVVKETEKYVRTSVTIYKNENDSKIIAVFMVL